MATGNTSKPSAPINITQKRPSAQAQTTSSGDHRPQSNRSRFELGPASLQERVGFEPVTRTSSSLAVAMPCQACQRFGLRCVTRDDKDGCTPCLEAGAECSLLALSPQSRKRKLHGEPSGEGTVKRGFSTSDLHSRRHTTNRYARNTTSASLLEDFANVGGPTSLGRTLGLQLDRHSLYIGHTTDFEPSLLNLSDYDPENENTFSRGSLRKVSEGNNFLLVSDSTTRGYAQQQQDVMAVEALVAPHGRALIDLFFQRVHPAFPIVQQYVFIEKYERDYQEFSPSLLAAVYLLAINWWSHSPALAELQRPDTDALERIVRSSLADSMCRPKLSTVEAALLLAQIPGSAPWASTAQLVAISQELGLHLDSSGWDIPPWEKGVRKRLSWAVYMQDKWGALIHGRPSHIAPSNWAVRGLTVHDFPDIDPDECDAAQQDENETGRVVFMRFVQLTTILTEILDTFYTLAAMHKVEHAGAQGAQMVLAQAKPIQLKLKEWYADLPACVRLESLSASSGRSTPSAAVGPAGAAIPGQQRPPSANVGYLHLAYFSAEISLHRRIVGVLSASPTTVDSYLEDICRSAAKARLISSMDFVNRLSPAHLRAFWYFASKTGFALIGTFGALLWATSPGREEADWYRRRLAEYRWTLSVSAKQPGQQGRYLTGFAMDMLDTSTGLLLRQLPEKPSLSRRPTGAMDMTGRSLPTSFSSYGGSSGGLSVQGGGFRGMGVAMNRSSPQSLDSEDDSAVSDDEDDLEDDYRMAL
ncbi:nitrogen regulatory protein OTam [Cordyceps fumosorosea ARSEF 2679]|uniref:Nitrogen regulatory protein OTam n=1 Tax=Cordyceps fumosorosea (strain ARSEF 2679) TaxID=1081104 RepID=A0A167WIX8_CORFA|nr:nitrogen regulatory protein OTam [Cordyceps fumosorosea ARSEF 2679]OAA63846.1 nitrogen regulatory protein OTam [Cordyceps fumosorosea ARSEF 2679]